MIATVTAIVLAAAPLASAAHLPKLQITATDILNFALNLECLEAEFYSYAAFGKGLDDDLLGGGPASVGGKAASLTTADEAKGSPIFTAGLAEEIASDEIAHVRFLRSVLGDAAVPCPKMNVGSAFADAADAAVDKKLTPRFDPYGNDLFFLHGAFIFEDVGVTAYTGAVPALAALAAPSTVQAAAKVLAVEAYHAGVVRAKLAIASSVIPDDNTPQGQTPYGPIVNVVEAISDLRDAVDGKDDLDQGIVFQGAVNTVPVDDNGLVFARSVLQVLNIVYLGGKTEGGFFPDGINGVFGEYSREEITEALADLGAKVDVVPGMCEDSMDGSYGSR